MSSFVISLLIGIVAGLIDITPMLLQKLDKRALFSAFSQYLFAGIIIVHCDIPGIVWWLEGGLIALAMAIPVIIIISAHDRKLIGIVGGTALVLGTLIGIAGHYLL